jgi:hypothetical protein
MPATQAPASAATTSNGGSGIPIQNSKSVLNIRIPRAKNLRGSKGEKINSIVRAQFSDFDYKDSDVINETPDPEWGFNMDLDLQVDDKLIDMFITKKLVITVIEMLPKEKTAVLGTCELSLYAPFVSTYGRDIELKKTLNIMAVAGKGGQSEQLSSTVEVEVSLSNPLLPVEVMEAGNLMTITVDEMIPVPEEWMLKEGTEKDLNSSKYYSLTF